MIRAGTAILVFDVLLAWAPSAHAQPPGEQDKAAAQALFEDALRLVDAGRSAEACPKLRDSLALDPAIGTRFYFAECLERTGQLASAWTNYVQVADEASALNRREQEREARRRAEALRPRLPWVTIDVPREVRGMAGLEIRRDGHPIPEAQWNAPVPVDPGVYVLSASARGRARWQTRLFAREGERSSVRIPALAAEARPASPPPPPSLLGVHPQRFAGYVTSGVGVTALGVGAAFGVRAAMKRGQSSCDPQGHCVTSADAARLDQAISAAKVSTATFIAGGVLLAGGVVLMLTAPSPGARAPVGLSAKLTLGPTGIGASGTW